MSRLPASRTLQLIAAVLLILLAPVVGVLPGPGGVFVFAGGMVLLLRNSHWARMRWARLKRRWPRLGAAADRVMRRRSALRRRQRDVARDGARGGGRLG